jgi:hypothetical protein
MSEETIRALGFMSQLKFVTDPELIAKYIEAEARRKEWFESQGWEFTPNVDPKRLTLMSYDTVADIWGQTSQPEDKHDAFVAFMSNTSSDGPLRVAEYDKMICEALLAAFGKRTTNSTMKLFGDIRIQVSDPEHLLDDVITYVGRLATVNHDLGAELGPDELLQVMEVLNTGLSKEAPALGLVMRTATEGKGYSVDQFCEILVDKATERVQATDAFADWEKKSKGNRPLSDADRLRLNDLEKEVARLKKENERLLKAAKPNNPSTKASAVGNNGCFKCGKEGHRADQCPDNKPAPTTPRTAGGKSAGKKVSFSKLQLNTAVQEAVKNTVHEVVAAMEQKGWQKP